MALTPPSTITGAPLVPRSYGLFTVAPPAESTGGRWQAGAQWEATLTCPDPTGITGANCVDPEPPTVDTVVPDTGPTAGGTEITVTGSGFLATAAGEPKDIYGGPGWTDAEPFTVYAGASCSIPGRTEQQATERAQAELLAREEARVENAVATGAAGARPSFTDADILGEGPHSPVRALADLQQRIGTDYGGNGIVHLSPAAAIALGPYLVVSGSRLRTTAGTPVVVGAGYPGTAPDGSEPEDGTTWIYATPPVFIRRSEIFTNTGYDVTVNDRLVMAERTYLVGWDPCPVHAVQLNLECC